MAHASLVGDEVSIYGYVSDFAVLQEVTVDEQAIEVSCPDDSDLCAPFPLQDGDAIDIQALSIVLSFLHGRTIAAGSDRGGNITPTALHFNDLDLIDTPGYKIGNASLESNAPFVALDDGQLANTADSVVLTLANEDYGNLTFPDQYQIIISLTPIPELVADFDGDGDRDGADFLYWQRGISPDPMSQVDLADWEANYGTPRAPGHSATSIGVPEPATAIIFVLGAAVIGTVAALSRRRQFAL